MVSAFDGDGLWIVGNHVIYALRRGGHGHPFPVGCPGRPRPEEPSQNSCRRTQRRSPAFKVVPNPGAPIGCTSWISLKHQTPRPTAKATEGLRRGTLVGCPREGALGVCEIQVDGARIRGLRRVLLHALIG